MERYRSIYFLSNNINLLYNRTSQNALMAFESDFFYFKSKKIALKANMGCFTLYWQSEIKYQNININLLN